MKDRSNRSRQAALLLALVAIGCAHDPNQPGTLQQQAEMARGHQPTAEQLSSAMARFKAPGAGSQVPIPPQGQANGTATGASGPR